MSHHPDDVPSAATFYTPCRDAYQLHQWIVDHLHLRIPRQAVCPHHQAPFDYVLHSYFEPSSDVAVWAPRGGGKTRLAAVATLLDLLHKPGIGVRILGGSMEQSLRIWEHLLPDLETLVSEDIVGTSRRRTIRLANGSHAAAIAQSQAAVRGIRIQKLRCDELELFDPAVFEAAKLTTRSIKQPDGRQITGTIEAFSTLHTPWGLMHDLIEQYTALGKRVVKWCVLDVLETCPRERDCTTCPLWTDCRGLAKNADGFLPIDDAILLKQRASAESWDAEMLCKRPSVKGAVFPTFDPEVHVVAEPPRATEQHRLGKVATPRVVTAEDIDEELPETTWTLAIDFGFANPFVCLWVREQGRAVHVIDEYVQSGRSLEEHLTVIESRPWGRVRQVACDPAGNSRNDQTAESNVQLLRRRQYVVKSRGSRIVDGMELIRRGLKTGVGDVTLFIHPRCVHLIRALRSYHYPAQLRSELPFKDGEHDHLIDALRYFYVNQKGREGVVERRY